MRRWAILSYLLLLAAAVAVTGESPEEEVLECEDSSFLQERAWTLPLNVDLVQSSAFKPMPHLSLNARSSMPGYLVAGGIALVAVLVTLLLCTWRNSTPSESTSAGTASVGTETFSLLGMMELTEQPRDGPRKLTLDSDGSKVVPAAVSSTTNAVHTNHFTLLTWLPKSLYRQFHRIANVYFVAIAVLACTPFWGGQYFSKVSLVSSILFIQALKDGYEDWKNARDDKHVNAHPTRWFNIDSGHFEETEWQDVCVGSLILIEKKEPYSSIPADILVLASSGDAGLFYLCTKSLDGETNLKERQTPSLMQQVLSNVDKSPEAVAKHLLSVGLKLQLERPQVTLLELNCSLLTGSEACGVHLSHMALRGCELRNTSWILGVACYVGDDTKVRLNAAEPQAKISDLAVLLNNCVKSILLAILLISLTFAVFAVIFPGAPNKPDFLEVFVKYSIVLYCCLPMTLYIGFEFLHLIMGHQIETDPLMYDEETSTHAKARNTSVIEELGQVDFVFSDKTGTLTVNEMRFAACCVGSTAVESCLPLATGEPGPGVVKLRSMFEDAEHRVEAQQFFESLAICHTLKIDDEGNYEAESPDEVALAHAARTVELAFVRRQMVARGLIYSVCDAQGEMTDHTVAHILEFNSDRKRMSVVCPTSTGAVVITKGADNVMQDLLVGGSLPAPAQAALDKFSAQGLRTLVVARRQMDTNTYHEWRRRWEEAHATMNKSDEAIAAVAASAEVGMTYVGITALEDRLQDQAPETIKHLRDAGVRVWVLTGDKVETAVEIAKSCKLFDSDTNLISIVNEPKAAAVVVEARDNLCHHHAGSKDSGYGMVLDGASVSRILKDTGEARRALYEMAKKCSSCVCCRLSPMQKRELVELVRTENPQAITLSIGDGANDVPMIQGAHVGIGIRGKEGSASVQASDIAISQFRFLKNLLFCHGRKAYRRMSTFLCFYIYRSIALGWSYIFYACCTYFSGSLAFPEWLDMTFSFVTTSGVLILVAFDFDFADDEALRRPELYKPGPRRSYLNVQVFAKWMFFATLHGVLAFAVPMYWLTDKEGRVTQSHSFWQASFTAFTLVIIIVHLKLFVVAVKPMNVIGVAAITLEMLVYIILSLILSSTWIGAIVAPDLQHVVFEVVSSKPHVSVLIFVPLVALAADVLNLFVEVNVERAAGKLLTMQ